MTEKTEYVNIIFAETVAITILFGLIPNNFPLEFFQLSQPVQNCCHGHFIVLKTAKGKV